MMVAHQEMHSKASARTTTAKDMIVAKEGRGVMIFLTRFKTHQKTLVLLAKEATQKSAKKGHMVKHNKMREEAHQGLREIIRAAQDLTTRVNVMEAEIGNLTPIVEISTPILSLRCMSPGSKEELANLTSNKLLQNSEESERLR